MYDSPQVSKSQSHPPPPPISPPASPPAEPLHPNVILEFEPTSFKSNDGGVLLKSKIEPHSFII